MSYLEENLYLLPPANVEFDQNNPRGESEKQIMADPEFKKLITSIAKYGILEPIIVKREENSEKCILIDGERRLRAAFAAKISKIPVLIATSEANGRILAYQVHKLRKDWSKAAETKSIKAIIKDIFDMEPEIKEQELKKKLIEITKMRKHDVEALLTLIKYPNEVIEKVANEELYVSYLIQIENNFLNQIKRHYPEVIKIFNEDKIREIMSAKAIKNLLGKTRYLMDTFKEVFACKENTDDIRKILISFLKKTNENIETAYNKFKKLKEKKTPASSGKAKKTAIASKKTKQTSQVLTVKPDKTLKIPTRALNKIDSIRSKFEAIAEELSTEEIEYITEALRCFDNSCFKAAVVMIWATGVSRILKYISNNISDYDKSLKEMKGDPKSVYKHWANTFPKPTKVIKDISEVAERSKDVEQLCYLYYKHYISVPEFNKLYANYRMRCDCAHPTKVTLSPNEALVVFDNIYNLIFSNDKLK